MGVYAVKIARKSNRTSPRCSKIWKTEHQAILPFKVCHLLVNRALHAEKCDQKHE